MLQDLNLLNAKGVYIRPSMVISVTTMFSTNNHERIYTCIGCSCYEYLVAAYVTSGRMYTPLVVDAKTAWHSKGLKSV